MGTDFHGPRQPRAPHAYRRSAEHRAWPERNSAGSLRGIVALAEYCSLTDEAQRSRPPASDGLIRAIQLKAEVSVDPGVLVGDYRLNGQSRRVDADARHLLDGGADPTNSTRPWPISAM
jgi:hypothetical protein